MGGDGRERKFNGGNKLLQGTLYEYFELSQ
jgi:hypothetical protein